MTLAVIGASRGTGYQLATKAHQAGHPVTAVMRDVTNWNGPTGIPVAQADALHKTDLVQALAGHDTVAFCVGSVKGESTTVLRDGMTVTVDAMQELNIRRLIAISSSGHLVKGDDPFGRFIGKPLLARVLRDVNADLVAMEKIMSASDTDWTIVRPPRLLDAPAKGTYRQRRDGNVRWRYSITRSDLAQAMLDILADPTSIHHRISVSN